MPPIAKSSNKFFDKQIVDVMRFAVSWYGLKIPQFGTAAFTRYCAYCADMSIPTLGRVLPLRIGSQNHCSFIQYELTSKMAGDPRGEHIVLAPDYFDYVGLETYLGFPTYRKLSALAALVMIDGTVVHETRHAKLTCCGTISELLGTQPKSLTPMMSICAGVMEDLYINSPQRKLPNQAHIDWHNVLLFPENLSGETVYTLKRDHGELIKRGNIEVNLEAAQALAGVLACYKRDIYRPVFDSMLPDRAVALLHYMTDGGDLDVETRRRYMWELYNILFAKVYDQEKPASGGELLVSGEFSISKGGLHTTDQPVSSFDSSESASDSSFEKPSEKPAENSKLSVLVAMSGESDTEDTEELNRMLANHGPATCTFDSHEVASVFESAIQRYLNPTQELDTKIAIRDLDVMSIDPSTSEQLFDASELFSGMSQTLAELRTLRTVNKPIRPKETGNRIGRRLISRVLTDSRVFYDWNETRSTSKLQEWILLIDASGSMGHAYGGKPVSLFNNVVCGVYAVYREIVSAGFDVGVYAHTGDRTCDVYTVVDPGERLSDIVERFQRLLSVHKDENYDGYAISRVADKFTGKDRQRIILVASDGRPAGRLYSGINHTKLCVERIRESGTSIIALSLVKSVMQENDRIYGEAYNVDAQDFGNSLRRVIRRLSQF